MAARPGQMRTFTAPWKLAGQEFVFTLRRGDHPDYVAWKKEHVGDVASEFNIRYQAAVLDVSQGSGARKRNGQPDNFHVMKKMQHRRHLTSTI